MKEDEEKKLAPGLTLTAGKDGSQDAMSSLRRLQVTIGPMVPDWTMADLENALWELGDGAVRNVSVARRILEKPEASDAGNDGPLSPTRFRRLARHELAGIDEVIASLPPKHLERVGRALDHAIRLGGVLMELRMRERHLIEVTREKLMQKARRAGGTSRKYKTAADTKALIVFMDAKIKNGMTIRNAARIALKNKLGETEEGNRKRYEYWRKKNLGDVSPSLPIDVQSSGSSKHE